MPPPRAHLVVRGHAGAGLLLIQLLRSRHAGERCRLGSSGHEGYHKENLALDTPSDRGALPAARRAGLRGQRRHACIVAVVVHDHLPGARHAVLHPILLRVWSRRFIQVSCTAAIRVASRWRCNI